MDMLQEFERAIALQEPISRLKESLLAKERNRYEARRREIERSAEAAAFILQALEEPKSTYVFGVAKGYLTTFQSMYRAEVSAKRQREEKVMQELRKEDAEVGEKGKAETDGDDESGSDGIEEILSTELPEITP